MKSIEHTLYELARRLNSNQIHWSLGGSLMLKLRGIPMDVHDIDILVHAADFDLCCELLSQSSTELNVYESDVFKTKLYRKFKWNETEIDCMGGMSVQLPSMLFEYQFDHKDVDIIQDEHTIPLSYMEDWYLLYLLMPNRVSKLKCLESYFNQHSVNQERIHKLLSFHLPEQTIQTLKSLLKE